MPFKFLCFLLIFFTFSCKEKTLFTEIKSGIDFRNDLKETSSDNVLEYEYFYNGGGLGVGDFNNDGLQDLFFSGNQVDNKLYLNSGNLKFRDITESAGIKGRKNGWKTGVSVVDINADGNLDVYICYSGKRSPEDRKNELWINQGKKDDITFIESASEYGLADSGYSTQASFFDYDLDGDLDCFLINHNVSGYVKKEADAMRKTYDYNAGDKLFENIGISNGHPVFKDVSEVANIKANPIGFGLGLSISDVNQDGYPDIYVTNDFVEDDYLYINQQDGTFKDELRSMIPHTSYSSMGVDIADLNNDGKMDIVTTDMLPADNKRQKLLVWPDNWNVYQSQLQNGFWHQNMRNMLQLNQGNNRFIEIGQFAGISNTDWSWGILLADYDLDGYKDAFVSNGLPKDFTNIDFINYYSQNQKLPVEQFLKEMSSSNSKNYIFQNDSLLNFKNKQSDWGFDQINISNGCAYADLDNDGDLEIITNNINDFAKIYKNNLQETSPKNYLKIKLQGPENNKEGIGALITVTDISKSQYLERYLNHGYQSSSVDALLFGLYENRCNVKIKWPDGLEQSIEAKANQIITLNYNQAIKVSKVKDSVKNTLFDPKGEELDFVHKNKIVNDFNHQILLPNQYSYYGPKIEVADFNKDGQEDFIVSGTSETPAKLFFSKKGGFEVASTNFHLNNNQDIKIADLNNDGYLDIYFVNGSYLPYFDSKQNDEIWWGSLNGFSSFTELKDNINSQTAIILDFDNDKDLDIFIGGYIKPKKYPICEESQILINDGKGNFLKKSLGQLGLITKAISFDVNQDNFEDILLVGEWMDPKALIYENGNFTEKKISINIPSSGWWNNIEKADLDGDGDFDLVLGNIGLNTQLKANSQEPASLFYDDFDGNGNIDFFINYYIQGKPYPAYSRDELVEQMPVIKRKFNTYEQYSNAQMEDIFPRESLKKAKKLIIDELKTLVLENNEGKFDAHFLPIEAQYAPVYSILLKDLNHDGKKDIILGGNNDKFRLRIGKVFGNFGQVFINKGNFKFQYMPPSTSGLYVKGNVRDIKKVDEYFLFGINNSSIYSTHLSNFK